MRADRDQRDEAQQGVTDSDEQAQAHPAKNKKAEPIDWSKWWPFERATGEALKQLNRKQRKPNLMDEFEEAPI